MCDFLRYTTALLTLVFTASAAAQNETILLRNVQLISNEGPDSTRIVSILIKDGQLDLMSEDLIPIDDADIAYDAAEGVVLGRLELGRPASFLILTEDPRENVDALLDTKRYAAFGIQGGEIVRNRLLGILEETPEERQRAEQGWLAYAPPPLAVPLDYLDRDRWNRWDTRWLSGIFAAAVVLDRTRYTEQDDESLLQVGDLDDFDGGEIRGLRFGGVGTINFDRPWVWTVFGATNAFDKGFDTESTDDFTWFDWRLDIPVSKRFNFSVGKQKEPISMERVMSLAHWPIQERSTGADALLPSRNVGLVASGSMFDDRVSVAGGVFNNWIDRDQPSSFSDNATQFVGRATWVPWQSDNESSLLHFGLGYRYSDAKEGGLTGSEPEFNQAPNYIQASVLDADRIDTYQAEASLRSGPFWLHGEYLRTDADRRFSQKETYDAYNVTASWILSGEVRDYNKRVGIFGKVPISRTVDQNGWGAWELAARYSSTDLSENVADFGFSDFPVQDGGKVDIWSAGLNWWLSPYLNVSVNYRYITLDRFGFEGTSQGFNSRLVLILE